MNLGDSAVEARLRRLEAQLAAHEAKLDAQQLELDRRRKELDELQTATIASETAKEPAFRIYGFIDIGLQKLWTDDQSTVETTAATFVLGNANLYFDFRPDKSSQLFGWPQLASGTHSSMPMPP